MPKTVRTARKLAIEAATKTISPALYRSDDEIRYDPADCAEAASDVWEPIVTELLAALGTTSSTHRQVRRAKIIAEGALGYA